MKQLGMAAFSLIDHVRMADGRLLYALGRPLPRATAPMQPSKDFSGNWQFRLAGTPEQINQRLNCSHDKRALQHQAALELA